MSRLATKCYIKYISTVKLDELSAREHKISTLMADNSTVKSMVYRLPQNPGLETVLYCIHMYKQKALDILFDGDDLF